MALLARVATVACAAAAASSPSPGRLTPSNSGDSLTPINVSDTDVAALLAFKGLLLDPANTRLTSILLVRFVMSDYQYDSRSRLSV
jgi:hypothetical protein